MPKDPLTEIEKLAEVLYNSDHSERFRKGMEFDSFGNHSEVRLTYIIKAKYVSTYIRKEVLKGKKEALESINLLGDRGSRIAYYDLNKFEIDELLAQIDKELKEIKMIDIKKELKEEIASKMFRKLFHRDIEAKATEERAERVADFILSQECLEMLIPMYGIDRKQLAKDLETNKVGQYSDSGKSYSGGSSVCDIISAAIKDSIVRVKPNANNK